MEEGFIKNFLSNLKCPFCGSHYERDNVKKIRRKGRFCVFDILCPSCHIQGFVMAIVKEEKEAISDLSPEEMIKFSKEAPIGVDELLDIHNFLKGFDGDFSSLFAKGDKR